MAALRVSTGDMPARQRLAMWREEFGRGFLRIDIEPQDPEVFQAEAAIRILPGLKIASCVVSASLWRRTREMIDSGADEIALVFGCGEAATLSQRGRSFELGCGDAATCLHSEPADLVLPTVMGRHAGLIVPFAPVAELLRGGDRTPRRIDRNNEALRLLWGYLRVLSDDLTLSKPQVRQTVVTHVHDLVALTLGASRDGAEVAANRGMRAARLKAVKADVLANLARRDLSVSSVAERQHVTPRYVHKLFETEGTTFSQFVLGERLTAAHRMLADPRHDHRTIAEIAYTAGFGDLSHFNHAFRRRYGATPSETRMERHAGP